MTRASTRSTLAQLQERVACMVPGFTGYQDPGTRRDDDGRLRVEVCERLDSALAHMEDFLLESSEDGWSPAVGGLDEAIRALEAVRSDITMGNGLGSFFELNQVPEPTLTELMESDLALLVELDELGEQLEGLGPPHFRDGVLEDTLAAIDKRIVAVDQSYSRRNELARSMGGDESRI